MSFEAAIYKCTGCGRIWAVTEGPYPDTWYIRELAEDNTVELRALPLTPVDVANAVINGGSIKTRFAPMRVYNDFIVAAAYPVCPEATCAKWLGENDTEK